MKAIWKCMVTVSYFFNFTYVVNCKNNPIVHTKSGLVQGILSKDDKGTVYKFLKIPFAKPPVGNLRFRKAVPIDPWDDVIDATEHPPSCMQPQSNLFDKVLTTLEMSEDCLFLSVYVPNDLTSDKKKTVMVWIHGGGYHFGQASVYDGSHLALTGDVIVVTINYRLNVFGFLTTWDLAALGNYGLWDQILALQWVKDNIEAFGGNSQSITIFGESAGGFSVSFLSLTPRSKGLFNRVISQSGTANSPLAHNNKLKSYMNSVISDVGCNENQFNSSSIVECLRQVSAEALVNASDKVLLKGLQTDFILPISPRVDGDLITDDSVIMLSDAASSSNQYFQSLDYMVGFTDAEAAGMIMSGQFSNPEESFNVTEGISTKFFCSTFVPKMSKRSYGNLSEVTDAICNMYAVENGDTTNKVQQAKNAIDATGDFVFYAPAIKSLNTHARNNHLSKSYQYVFSRSSQTSLGLSLPYWFQGAPHASELSYLFDIKNYAEIANHIVVDDDFKLADIMMKYWTNFAKTGNPNSESLPVWPSYTEEKMEFINLNLETKQEIASANFKNRMRFWLKEISEIVGRIPSSNHEEL